MKKLFLGLVLVLSSLFLVACGNQANSTGATSAPVEKKPEIKTIQQGEVIKTSSAEVTINKISLSYDVLPDKTSGFYTHYPAKKGNVYIDVDATVKNVQKQELRCDKVLTVEANYNNGYQYSSMPVVKDEKTGFTYANISAIKPLESRGMKFLVDCPEEVESSKNQLSLTINIDGEKYQYTIR